MKIIYKRVLAATITATLFIIGSVFIAWGFDPSSWEPKARAVWFFCAILFLAYAAIFLFHEDL
jgi:hypothetical protein